MLKSLSRPLLPMNRLAQSVATASSRPNRSVTLHQYLPGAATVPRDHAWMMVTGWGGGGAPGQMTFLFRRAAGEKKFAAKCCFTAILSGFLSLLAVLAKSNIIGI